MEKLDLKDLNVSEISATEAIVLDGGCPLCYLYDFWDGVKEGFHKGASAGAEFMQ